MNLNALLGIIGLSLLAFVAAFAIGRLHRPTPGANAPASTYVTGSRLTQQSLPASDSDRTSRNNVDSVADEDPGQSESATLAYSESATAEATEFAEQEPTASVAPRSAAQTPPQPSPAETAAARQRAAENRIAIAARRAHADQLPDDFQKYYAQELPEDAIPEELTVRTRVSGAQADVITLSSPAFNSENKDFVLQQVRSELTELGFKQVYITDDRGFKVKTGL